MTGCRRDRPAAPDDGSGHARQAAGGSGGRGARAGGAVARRRLGLVGVGVLLAITLLALVEGGLRFAGLGGGVPLLRPLELASPPPDLALGAALYEVHPRLAGPFFGRTGPGGGELLGSHRRELVVQPKPAGTRRIVLVGASTIEGFPLPRSLTAARFLAAMIDHVAPGQPTEVLNLGVTAVASFPIRKIAIAAIEQLEPDAVVVYEAHNEFFGASGMASYQAMGRAPWVQELTWQIRRLALYEALVDLTASPPSPARELGRDQLIQVMAAVPEIAPEGELHAAARRSLAANYGAILAAGRAHGVPVMLATVVSNERDLVPVASWQGDLAPAAVAAFEERLAGLRQAVAAASPAGEAASPAGPPAEAPRVSPQALEAELATLVAAAPRHAEATYWHARALELAGQPAAATEGYRRARDLDAMPWRASRDKNQLLRELAAAHDAPLADCEALFAAAAADPRAPGATGWTLFVDHVHPSLDGQALLAWAFLERLIAAGVVAADPERVATLPDRRVLATRLGANALELYALAHKMATLFRAPPFAAHNAAAAERAEALLTSFRAQADGVELAALEHWETASREAGFALPISFFGGVAALSIGEPTRAGMFLRDAEASALPWTDERVAVLLLRTLSEIALGAPPATAGQRVAAALDEVQRMATLPDRPTALLARVHASLLYLAGDPAAPGRAAEATRLAAGAPPWQRALVAALPEPASLGSVANVVALP